MYKLTGAVCLLAIFALPVGGYGQETEKDLKNRLVGKWVADVEKTIEHAKENGSEEAELAMYREMLPGMKTQFTANGKMVMIMKMGPETSTNNAEYSVKEVDVENSALTIAVTMEESDEEKTGTVTFADEDSFKLETDEGDVLFFKRAPSDEDDDDDADDDDDDDDDDGR